MEALFLNLLNMSISASWMILAVLALRFAMKKAPRWAVCSLWALVAVRLIFPFSIESVFSLIPSTQTLPQDILTENRFHISSGVPVIDHQINDVVLDDYYEGITVPTDNGFNVMSTLTVVWLLGMAAIILYAIISYLRLRHKVSASINLRENIYLCDYIESPFILGILKPRIYLPSNLEESHWPHVLSHERAHLQRKDHWWKPIGYALTCLHWFNPLMWVAYVLLCRDIELACDEKVIRELGETEKKSYSEALLSCSVPRYMIAACPLAFGEVGVKERVKSVLNYKKPAFWIILIAVILCIIAAVCFLTDPISETSLLPGRYRTDYRLYFSDGTAPSDTQYILDDRYSLYQQAPDGTVTFLGELEPVTLSNSELLEYAPNDNGWTVSSHTIPDITDAYWLYHEDRTFHVMFQTCGGDTYLGYGFEDYSERGERFNDDTSLFALYRLSGPGENTISLTAFRATVLEVQAGQLLVEPDEHAVESASSDRIWVSVPEGSPELAVGDTVEIVYDGLIQETYPAQIRGTFSIRLAAKIQYTAVSGTNQADTILRPWGTSIESIAQQIDWLVVEPNEDGLLRFDVPGSSGWYRIYDATTLEEIPDFNTLGSLECNWDLLEPGHNYIVTRRHNELVCFGILVPHDFGITMTARDSSPTGITVDCTQSGGTTAPGHPITYGKYYHLQVLTENGWEDVPELSTFYTTTEAIGLQMDSTTTWSFDWTSRYGALEPGTYCFVRYFSYGSIADLTYLPFYAIFEIPNEPDPTEPSADWTASIEIVEATATEAVIAYHVSTIGSGEVWTGHDFRLEVLTDEGWTHYGYPQDEMAWEDALLFHFNNIRSDSTDSTLYSDVSWSRIADAPLPAGTYRFCKDITYYAGEDTTSQTFYAEFTIPEGYPENWGITLEVLDPTPTGATLACTYHGGLFGYPTTTGEYYLMADVGNDAVTKYGLVPSQVVWNDICQFILAEGNTVYWEVQWSQTADAPLPSGTYYVVKEIEKHLSVDGKEISFSTQVTAQFTIP